ncbi:MAG: arginine--tRNA ligase [Planctomycetaceae bacterium]|nr:arginine--tRNA ligase [Planctomycetaceae bacterium]
MNVLKELRHRTAKALAPLVDDPQPFAAMVKPAQDAQFGDYQANCAMPLAGKLKQKPREIAEQIVANLEVDDLCEPPEIAGPGFINFKLKDDWIASQGQALLNDERLGVEDSEADRTVVVDFSSPNVAKPMHVGHLRSTVLGDAICRILRFRGTQVHSDNHIGDWGTQFGMIIYGYKHFLDQSAFAENQVAELSRLYRLVNQLSDYHAAVKALPELEEQLQSQQQLLEAKRGELDTSDKKARKEIGKLEAAVKATQDRIESTRSKLKEVESDPALKALADQDLEIARHARLETAKLHQGDAENTELWNQFLPACLAMLHQMYERLDIHFDMELGESFYQPMLTDVVDSLKQQGLASESDGAMCVFIEGNDAPFLVQKQDGAFTYATTDLATIRYRINELKADEILYVVDARQSEHFKLLFETARQWGFDQTEYQHVSFGTILGEDKRPFKTRSGDTVGLESLIDEAVAQSRKIVDEIDDSKPDGPELDAETRANVAEMVGIGGIKYADLRHNRDSDYVFSWDKMLAKDGDTATYVQYAHARICGIFRKGDIDRASLRTASGSPLISAPEERALLLQLTRFGEAIEAVCEDYRPNQLTQYLFELSNLFSSFYVNCIVLKEENAELRTSRLKLCDLTARTLQTGLKLLGIETPEQM